MRTFPAPETAAHLLRMRKVNLIAVKAPWKRKFSTRLPMFVLVSRGILIVRREEHRDMALTGDVLLLTPGSFELMAVPLPADATIRFEYAKIPLSVFGKQLSRGSAIEQAALVGMSHGEYNGIHICKGMLPQVARNLQTLHSDVTAIESVTNTLMASLCHAVFPFLRTVHFLRRWAFLGMMESHARHRSPVEFLAANYVAGRAAFFRDCQLHTGLTPAKWIDRRQMELADAWIHAANRTVAEVAALLHYDDVRLFRTAYRKHFRRPPEDPGMDANRSLSLDDPFCCLRPFWWPAPLPLLGVCQWPGLRPEELPEPFEEIRKFAEAPPESRAQLPVDVAPDLPPEDAGDTEPKPMAERFRNLEMIPISEIIEFPTGLPELLKAA